MAFLPPVLPSLPPFLPSSPPPLPQYGEELVHDGVDKGIGQEAGPVKPDLGPRIPWGGRGGRERETGRLRRRSGGGIRNLTDSGALTTSRRIAPLYRNPRALLFLFPFHFLLGAGHGGWWYPYMMRPSRRELISEGVFWMEMTVLRSSSKNSVTWQWGRRRRWAVQCKH